MAAKTTTNENIRDLINELRLELKGDIKDVAQQVSAIEKTVTDNEIKQAVSSTKVGMLITGLTIVVSGFTTIVIEKLTGRT